MRAIRQTATSQSRQRRGQVILFTDHDLPVLAAESNPRDRLDWESLIEAGIVPGLLDGSG